MIILFIWHVLCRATFWATVWLMLPIVAVLNLAPMLPEYWRDWRGR